MNQYLGISGIKREFYSGDGFIAGESPGLVTVAGIPAKRQIFLYLRLPNELPKLMDVVWSNTDGTYKFDMLNRELKFMLIAVDYQQQYEPIAWDYITPANRNE